MLKSVATLEGHEDRVWCVSWSPSGNLLASCGGDHCVKIWRQDHDSKWKCIETLSDGHTRTIRWVSWSPCGNKLGKSLLFLTYNDQ